MLNNLFHLFHFEYLLNPSTFVISILAIGIPLYWIMCSDRPNHFRPIPLTTGNQSRGRTGGRGRGQFFPRPLPIHSVVRPRIPPEDRHPITNTNNGGDGGHNQDSEEEESDLEENNHMENNPAIESDKANEVKPGTILSIALTLHSLGIPYEVVDIILDFAECWCVKQHSQMTKLVNGFQNANDMVLSLGPTVGRAGIGENMVKKIEFWCDSHVHGWSSYPAQQGTTDGSCTWGELNILTPQRTEKLPNRIRAFTNIHARIDWQTHYSCYDSTHDLVKSMKGGDSIAFWVRSAYPGWAIYAKNAKLKVYYR